MPVFTILHDGEEIPPSGSPAPASNTYEISAIPAPTPDPDFPLSMQWQSDGVDLGLPNPRVINFTGDPSVINVTRGTGEKSNVVTVRMTPAPPVTVAITWNTANPTQSLTHTNFGWSFEDADLTAGVGYVLF